MTPREPAKRSAGFDPYAILGELEASRVAYVLIGGLARVLQGSDEDTHGVDLVPSQRPENIERLSRALRHIGAESAVLRLYNPSGPVVLDTLSGEVTVVATPSGTHGYEDLRRKATRLHLGEGLRPQVAAPGDLVRMLEALAQPEQARVTPMMRRVVELDRGLEIER